LAAELLKEFRDGTSKNFSEDNPRFFGWNSSGSKELFSGLSGDYYRNITVAGLNQLAALNNGKIPITGAIDVLNIPAYGKADYANGISDGINLGDVIGTFTKGVVAHAKPDGYVYFTGRNTMSLESFSGQNILRHNAVQNPISGRFSNTYQVIEWKVRIPKNMQ
jgi:hypothetical protein